MELEDAKTVTDTMPLSGRNALRLLSFNIQTGVDTQDFHEYVTKSWKHLLPLRERISNLNRIGTGKTAGPAFSADFFKNQPGLE